MTSYFGLVDVLPEYLLITVAGYVNFSPEDDIYLKVKTHSLSMSPNEHDLRL